jgi:ribosomal protein L18
LKKKNTRNKRKRKKQPEKDTNLFKWLWELVFGKPEQVPLNVHVTVNIENKGTPGSVVVQETATRSVTPGQPNPSSQTQIQHKKTTTGGATAEDIAEMMLSTGIEKAVDKTGEGGIAKDKGSGVDNQLKSLRDMHKKKKS